MFDIFRPVPNLAAVKTAAVKKLGDMGFTTRICTADNHGDIIIAMNGTEVGVATFTATNNSFTITMVDAFGVMVLPKRSYIGRGWKRYLESQLMDAVNAIQQIWVPNGHKINPAFVKMLREIENPC